MQTYHAQPILDLIGKHESRGDYGVVYGGIPVGQRPLNLTSMTIAQVREWQENVVKRGAKSSAAGKYQIIRKTLDAIVEQTGIRTNRKFDAATQDEMAIHLLKGRGFQRYLDGKLDLHDMVLALSKEWASLPVPSAMRGASRQLLAGQSYYSGDGLNKASATVAEVEQALEVCRERYRSGATADRTKAKPAAGRPASKLPVLALFLAAALFAALTFFGG